MTLEEFRSALRVRVLAIIPSGAQISVSEEGSNFQRGALTVHVASHTSAVALSYVAQPTLLFGHSSFGLAFALTSNGLDEAVRFVCSWLEDPFLHRQEL